jgi:hypothetical protein
MFDGLSADDRAILADILAIVKRTIPDAGGRPPRAVLAVMQKALRDEFG